MELSELKGLVDAGTDLSASQAREAADCMASPREQAKQKAEFLAALANKGETSVEIAAFAKRFKELARDPGLGKWAEEAIDVCGTGGDKQSTFNISTTVMFVLAAAGLKVLKHGNRSITSSCGSSQLLEALGVDMAADNETLARSTDELGFCFMFAPAFHPAFKEIMPVRQRLAERGQRSIFNILGPLINPGRPAFQLIGVFHSDLVSLLAKAQDEMGLKAGMVAHCELGEKGGMDEFSVAGENVAVGFGTLSDVDVRWSPEEMGVAPGDLSDLQGGDVQRNLEILEALLAGKAPRALEDTVIVNAAAAMHVMGRYPSVAAGTAEARALLLGGAVKAKIEATRDFYASL